MITYIALIITSLVGVLGVFLKTTKENTRSKNIKRLTVAGWVMLLLMTILSSISLIDQYHKEKENELIKKLSQSKDSLNAAQTLRLLEKANNDSLNNKTQREYLQSLLSSAQKINTTQTFAIKQTDKYNNYLTRQIEVQRIQNERILNPLEKVGLKYILQIPASQKVLLEYKKRVLSQYPCPKCDFINLSDRSWLPDQSIPSEKLFAWFLMDMFATVSFKEPSIDDFDGKSDLLIKSAASTSVEEMIERKTNSSLTNEPKPRVTLDYSKKGDFFLIEISDPNPFQRHSKSMLSFKDFSEKEVLIEVGIGVAFAPQLSQDYIKMIQNIDFNIYELSLHTEKYERRLDIINFKSVQNICQIRRFKSKLKRNLPF